MHKFRRETKRDSEEKEKRLESLDLTGNITNSILNKPQTGTNMRK